MSLFARRLEAIAAIPERALAAAAPRIAAQLQSDATSRKGNVPPGISAAATSSGVTVSGPGWVLDRVAKFNEAPSWVAILSEEIANAAKAGA